MADANPLAAKVHDRMPVILDPPDYDAWLDPSKQDVASMLDQLLPDRMTVRPVSTFVNVARHEGFGMSGVASISLRAAILPEGAPIAKRPR